MYVPKILRERLVDAYHMGVPGIHQGAGKVYLRIKVYYYWPGLKQFIKLRVGSCTFCGAFRNRVAGSNLNPISRFERNALVSLDCVGGQDSLPTTSRGNSVMLVMIDHFSKFMIVSPMKDMTAKSVSEAFEKDWVMWMGAPTQVLTDNGGSFIGAEFETLLNLYKIGHLYSSPHYPQGNGGVERVNRTILECLRTIVLQTEDPGNWDRLVQKVCFVYNSTEHSATKFSPHFLSFGRHPTLGNEPLRGVEVVETLGDPRIGFPYTLVSELEKAQEAVRKNFQGYRDILKVRFDKRHFTYDLEVGDEVRMQKFGKKSKFTPRWVGPYLIETLNGAHVLLRDPRTNRIISTNRNMISKPIPKEKENREESAPKENVTSPRKESLNKVVTRVTETSVVTSVPMNVLSRVNDPSDREVIKKDYTHFLDTPVPERNPRKKREKKQFYIIEPREMKQKGKESPEMFQRGGRKNRGVPPTRFSNLF